MVFLKLFWDGIGKSTDILLNFIEDFPNYWNSILLKIIPFLLSPLVSFLSMLLDVLPLLLKFLRSLLSLVFVLYSPGLGLLV